MVDNLKERVQYLPTRKLNLVDEAHHFVQETLSPVREGQQALKHSVGTALLLAELGLDAPTIAAALLHHLPQEGGVSIEQLKEHFGSVVAKLVDGVARLSALPATAVGAEVRPELQAENLRRMLIALAADIRVVFIRLSEQLELLGRVEQLPAEQGRLLAQETLEIYAPLAHRMGIARLFREMEDMAFSYLEPAQFQHLSGRVSERLGQWHDALSSLRQELEQALARNDIAAEIASRTKHIYSISQKLQRYLAQGKDLGDIHDLIAVRVVVETLAECYSALGLVHSLWHPVPNEFNDYIANPKGNGYQSLHTTVIYQGLPVEIQLRTTEMHQVAELGLAAHWHYKTGGKIPPQEWVGRVRQFLEKHREMTGEEFLESIRTDVFQDRVFAYTPKGEIKELPAGATPLDFAYRIHTDLGHRCIGAKVNNKMVPLSYQLNNGDRVEILAARSAKGPSRDWLNPALGYVKTVHAKDKIRQWFKHLEREENLAKGRELLERELRRLGLGPVSYDELARSLGYTAAEDFFVGIGYGAITPHQAVSPLIAPQPSRQVGTPQVAAQPLVSEVTVKGVSRLLTKIAACCHPLPGDQVIGYITRSRGISIHRQNCPNILHEEERERLIPVEWGVVEQFYPVAVEIRAWDRVGLLRDISSVVAEEKINIQEIKASEKGDHSALVRLTLQSKDLAQLSRILTKLEGIPGVISATRGK